MNWTCVVYGGPMALVALWWIVSARKWFKGPKVNIEHMMLGREEAVIEGQGPTRDSKDRESSSSGAKVAEEPSHAKA